LKAHHRNFSRKLKKQNRRKNQKKQRKWKNHLSSPLHQKIIPIPRKTATNPHKKKHKRTNLNKKKTPPKKIKTVSILRKIIIPYSQMKIKEKIPPPYSTLKPDTNSDSPSEKSKGLRLLSDKQTKNQPIKKTTLTKKNK